VTNVDFSEANFKNKLSGKFIALDGPDGCGKTTQTELLVKRLTRQGVPTLGLRDPGATPVGEKIRRILLNPEHSTISTATEVMLYMAARIQLWNEEIQPALGHGKCVVLDRWLSSTCAYQGCAGGFGIDKVLRIAADCLDRPWPDLTILLDVDLKTAASRLDKELDRMEQKGDGYHRKVRQGFLELARRQKHIIVIDASADVKTVHLRVTKVLSRLEF